MRFLIFILILGCSPVKETTIIKAYNSDNYYWKRTYSKKDTLNRKYIIMDAQRFRASYTKNDIK